MLRIVYSSCFRTIWTDKPVYPDDPQDISHIVDGCYAAGHYPPNYPVPTTIRYIKAGILSGLIDRPNGQQATWVYYYNHPLPDGTLCEWE